MVVWPLARILSPSIRLVRLEGAARVLFAATSIYAFLSGASAIVVAITLFELTFSVSQFLPVEKNVATS